MVRTKSRLQNYGVLQSYGLGTTKAARIYKIHGDDTIDKITDNTYRLVHHIHSVGLKKAD